LRRSRSSAQPSSTAVPVRTLAADPNTGLLYGTQVKDLYEIDPKTGAQAFIGTIDDPELFLQVFALAIGRDGYGYATEYPDMGLFRVDLATAESTFLCYLGSMSWFEDMAFDDDGMLWGIFAFDGNIRRADIQTCNVDSLYDHYADGIEVIPAGRDCYPTATPTASWTSSTSSASSTTSTPAPRAPTATTMVASTCSTSCAS
jgi:hypothetical protein